MSHLLEVKNLQTHFPTRAGLVRAVDGVSFHVDKGELLSLVGESGCGKSITALSVMRLVSAPGKIAGGEIKFDGEDLLAASEVRDARDSRRRHRDDLSGPDDFAQSRLHHRRPDCRSAEAASQVVAQARRGRRPSKRCGRFPFQTRRGAWTIIRINSPAGCGSA